MKLFETEFEKRREGFDGNSLPPVRAREEVGEFHAAVGEIDHAVGTIADDLFGFGEFDGPGADAFFGVLVLAEIDKPLGIGFVFVRTGQ